MVQIPFGIGMWVLLFLPVIGPLYQYLVGSIKQMTT